MPYSENTNPIYPDAANTDPIYRQPQYGSPDARRLFEGPASARSISTSLRPHNPYILDSEFCLVTDPVLDCPVRVEIFTADQGHYREEHDAFLLLDVRDSPRDASGNKTFGENKRAIDPGVDYLLIGRNFDPQTGQGLKGIRRGETVRIGRGNPTAQARFGLAQTPAENAFTLTEDENGIVTIVNDGSPRGIMLLRGFAYTGRRDSSEFKDEKYSSKDEEAPYPNSEQDRPSHDDVLSPEDEQLLAGLGAQTSAGVAELRKKFGPEIDEHNISISSIIGVVNMIKTLRAEGVPDNKIKRRVLFNLHPDRAASPQQSRYNEVLFKAADDWLRQQ